jgi:hypothetical protein
MIRLHPRPHTLLIGGVALNGHQNDADELEIGNGQLTLAEQRSQ